MATNRVHRDWDRCFSNELNRNMLLDNPKGRTAYACGIAFALQCLDSNLSREELDRLRVEAREFVEDYMR